jgi:hypothetical protein
MQLMTMVLLFVVEERNVCIEIQKLFKNEKSRA